MFVPLGELAGGLDESMALAVSADGSTIVGYGSSASGYEAFRWTSGGGMVGLGELAGGLFDSKALGVSADGSTIVGSSITGSGSEAFVLDETNGMRELDLCSRRSGSISPAGRCARRAASRQQTGAPSWAGASTRTATPNRGFS